MNIKNAIKLSLVDSPTVIIKNHVALKTSEEQFSIHTDNTRLNT